MNLTDIINRSTPEPWQEGDNIPWHEPAFSQRMLREHLTQEHDLASRPSHTIDAQVQWIHEQVLGAKKARILDLGCGPGLYSSRLAAMGHSCVGIDYSPAAIAYARSQAQEADLDCHYILEDVRTASYGTDFDLVMQIYGEINVFSRSNASRILRNASAALVNSGSLLLEAHTFEVIEEMGSQTPSWFSAETGLFSEAPHTVLTERFWHQQDAITTIRHYVIDAKSASVVRMAQSLQAYSLTDYESLLYDNGFENLIIHPSLTGRIDQEQEGLFSLIARKKNSA